VSNQSNEHVRAWYPGHVQKAKRQIRENLKKIAAATSKESSVTSSSIEDALRRSQPGDPNCKICGGLGFVRQDLPVEHPDFGKMKICVCRQQNSRNAPPASVSFA